MNVTRNTLVISIAMLAYPGTSAAQCQCKFDTTAYSAVGTRAACNAYFYNNKNCEIAFSALGASTASLKVIGLSSEPYRSNAYKITSIHVKALSKSDWVYLSNEAFLREALPLFMRAAYLRESVAQTITESVLVDLDKEVTSFLKEYTHQIARVFSGEAQPVGGTWKRVHSYAIGVGVVRFTHAEGVELVSVVFPSDREP